MKYFTILMFGILKNFLSSLKKFFFFFLLNKNRDIIDISSNEFHEYKSLPAKDKFKIYSFCK